MPSQEKYRFASSRIILIRNGKVLLGLRKNLRYASNQWMLPGGTTESNETVLDSLIRETQEETGVFLYKDDLTFVSVAHWFNGNNKTSGLTLFWSTDKFNGNVENVEDDKCVKLDWFTKEDIEKHRSKIEVTCLMALEQYFIQEKVGTYIECP